MPFTSGKLPVIIVAWEAQARPGNGAFSDVQAPDSAKALSAGVRGETSRELSPATFNNSSWRISQEPLVAATKLEIWKERRAAQASSLPHTACLQ